MSFIRGDQCAVTIRSMTHICRWAVVQDRVRDSDQSYDDNNLIPCTGLENEESQGFDAGAGYRNNMDGHLENELLFQSSQLITYMGSKRRLLPDIEQEIVSLQKELGSARTVNVDLFSGSGCVARMLKRHSSILVANDLEEYARVINDAFLMNWTDFDSERYEEERARLNSLLDTGYRHTGIIATNYAPADTNHIQRGERAFYTQENALIIDTIREFIETIADENTATCMLAMLLVEASIHVNTSGVFKGFYKDRATGIGRLGGAEHDALRRILGRISIGTPHHSRALSETNIMRMDAKTVFAKLGFGADITYIDPPYNQHPYGSNYFMLNLLIDGEMPDHISKVSGIPRNWNRSNYNRKPRIREEFRELLESLNSKYSVFSYNSKYSVFSYNNEGFLTLDEITGLIEEYYGPVTRVKKIDYTTFRGSRNLGSRNIHTKEYLIVGKNKQ